MLSLVPDRRPFAIRRHVHLDGYFFVNLTEPTYHIAEPSANARSRRACEWTCGVFIMTSSTQLSCQSWSSSRMGKCVRRLQLHVGEIDFSKGTGNALHTVRQSMCRDRRITDTAAARLCLARHSGSSSPDVVEAIKSDKAPRVRKSAEVWPRVVKVHARVEHHVGCLVVPYSGDWC